MKKLNEIQQKLKAPKNQRNEFAKFNYRSCEDILEAVKPLLGTATLVITDEVVNIGNRYYVKATVKLKDNEEEISNTAFARESEIKKGMDESQITGSTSSYARKYALNGLFLIDDTKDADTMDNTANYSKEVKEVKLTPFEQSVKKIKVEKDKEKLKEWEKKIEASKIYTEDEKFELISLINEQ